MKRILPVALLLALAAVLPACTAGPRGAGGASGSSDAASGPEVALTVRPASFTPIAGWRMIEAPGTDEGLVYVGPDALLTEADVVTASLVDDPDGEPALRLDFDDAGARRLHDHSEANLNEPVAFFVDHELVSVPVIIAPMARSAVINASLDRFNAQRIAAALTR